MIVYSILLEADCPELNIRRSYLIEAGQDLFGNWIVEINYGRIGCKGRKKRHINGLRTRCQKGSKKNA